MILRQIVSAYRMDTVLEGKTIEESTAQYTLRWCLSGKVSIALEDDVFLLRAGQVLLLPPHQKVAVKFLEGEGVRYAVTCFSVEDETALLSLLFQPITAYGNTQRMLFDYFYTASQVFGGETACCQPLVSRYAMTMLEGVLLRFALCKDGGTKFVLPENVKVSTHVEEQKITAEIKRYLQRHFSEAVTLDHLSKTLGVSKNVLMRSFRADTGQSIIEYFMRKKIERAIELIIEGELSFRTISENLGFQSPEYFSRVFKKQTGMTPTEFSLQSGKWGGCLASMY